MTNNDQRPAATDHTVAVIGGVVALIGLLVVLAIGLEEAQSEETMPIMAMIGTGIVAVVIGQVIQLSRTESVAKAAKGAAVKADVAAATAEDTNVRAQDIQRALNGGFESRVTHIVSAVMDQKFAERDTFLRVLIAEELERRDVGCRTGGKRA